MRFGAPVAYLNRAVYQQSVFYNLKDTKTLRIYRIEKQNASRLCDTIFSEFAYNLKFVSFASINDQMSCPKVTRRLSRYFSLNRNLCNIKLVSHSSIQFLHNLFNYQRIPRASAGINALHIINILLNMLNHFFFHFCVYFVQFFPYLNPLELK